MQDGGDGVFYGTNKDAPTLTTPTVTFAYIAKIKDDQYQQISWAGIEDEVYVVVRTTGLIGKTIKINIIDSDAIIAPKEYTSISFLQDNVDKGGTFVAKVNSENLAIFKLQLKPSNKEKEIKIWHDK